MRIIHTADLHLESSLIKLTPSRVRERKDELYMTFVKMVDEATRLSARLFIIAGDLFDTEKITGRSVERVTDVIERHADIDFLYLPGNHEGTAFLDKIASMPKNLKVFGDEWTYFDYGEVVVAGRNILTANMFSELSLDAGRKNIVVLHGALKDYSGASDGISLPDAAECPIGYLALGHYHSYTEYKLSEKASAVYSGTPEGRGFDEVGEHGFVLVDTDTTPIHHKFCPAAKRRVRMVKVNISGCARRIDVEDACMAALCGIPSVDLVRLVLTGDRPPEFYPDLKAITDRFTDRYYYFEVKDESKLRIDPEAYAYDKSLKGEFIRLVYSREDLSPEMKDKIIRCGINALLGEDCDI